MPLLKKEDLENNSPIILSGLGLEKNNEFRSGIRPIIIPGITNPYTYNGVLKNNFGIYVFSGFGTYYGIPMKHQFGFKSDGRFLELPDESDEPDNQTTSSLGLRLLSRNCKTTLNTRKCRMDYVSDDNNITFSKY